MEIPWSFVKELEYKSSESGDEMLGKWETKCSAFRRPKVRRKSPAAYREAQNNNKLFAVHS